jgi:cytidylate kinase
MSLVAISASYGAGGSHIAPALAERLDVPFVDRAIPMAVAAQLEVPVDDAVNYDENLGGRSWLERVLSGFVGGDTGAPAPVPADIFSSADFRRATEEVLLAQAASGRGVILGRAAVVVLCEDDRAFRVRLDGPEERRVAQAMRLGALDRAAAEAAMRRMDRVHADYTKQFYGVDVHDPSLYHLVLDSTAIPFEVCVDLVARAVEGRVSVG